MKFVFTLLSLFLFQCALPVRIHCIICFLYSSQDSLIELVN